MRFLKSSFALLSFAILLAGLSAAQNQTLPQSKQPAPSQPATPDAATPPAQNSAPEFKLFPAPRFQYNAPRRTLDPASLPRPQEMIPDRGIYLKHPDGSNSCASIVSYNFSPGDNPQLESVTTCTPANTQATKRARAPHPAPQGPRVLQSVLSDQKE